MGSEHPTVAKARKSTGNDFPVGKRVDHKTVGKARRFNWGDDSPVDKRVGLGLEFISIAHFILHNIGLPPVFERPIGIAITDNIRLISL